MWCVSNRLHRGRSGRSFSRSNSRNRSTSRAPPCHRTTPSDQQGGSSGHQLLNVALPNGQRPTQIKAKAKGDTRGRPAAPIKTKELHQGENKWEPKAEGIVCTASPVIADGVGEAVRIKYNKKTPKKTKNKKKHTRKVETVFTLMSPCIMLSLKLD